MTKSSNVNFDVAAVRNDFPVLKQEIHNHPLVYLDSAATTLKPQCVIDAISDYYGKYSANIHRGVHQLSELATDKFEKARDVLQNFIGAEKREEIIFTSGTTASLNMIALGYGRANLQKGDEIIISEAEHHSNIVPWQFLCEQIGCVLKVAPKNNHGE